MQLLGLDVDILEEGKGLVKSVGEMATAEPKRCAAALALGASCFYLIYLCDALKRAKSKKSSRSTVAGGNRCLQSKGALELDSSNSSAKAPVKALHKNSSDTTTSRASIRATTTKPATIALSTPGLKFKTKSEPSLPRMHQYLQIQVANTYLTSPENAPSTLPNYGRPSQPQTSSLVSYQASSYHGVLVVLTSPDTAGHPDFQGPRRLRRLSEVEKSTQGELDIPAKNFTARERDPKKPSRKSVRKAAKEGMRKAAEEAAEEALRRFGEN